MNDRERHTKRGRRESGESGGEFGAKDAWAAVGYYVCVCVDAKRWRVVSRPSSLGGERELSLRFLCAVSLYVCVRIHR